MVQLFLQGRLGTDDPDAFRALFAASGTRLMAGVATDDFGAAFSTDEKAGRPAGVLQPAIEK